MEIQENCHLGILGEVGHQAHLSTGSHFERFNFVDKASA